MDRGIAIRELLVDELSSTLEEHRDDLNADQIAADILENEDSQKFLIGVTEDTNSALFHEALFFSVSRVPPSMAIASMRTRSDR